MAEAVGPRPLGRFRNITSPEGVPLPFRIAGLGERLGAQLADVVLTMLFLGALVLGAFLIFGFQPWQIILFVLGFFILRVPYYILTELVWNGATLGKRLLGLRVVSLDGGTLPVHAVVARSLLKEAEVFLPLLLIFDAAGADGVSSLISGLWCLIALAIPVFNRYNQRLGDILAGTVVIHRPAAVLLPDAARLATTVKSGRFAFAADQLEHYGAYELQTLEALLQRLDKIGTSPTRRQKGEDLGAVVDAIRKKIGFGDAVPARDHAVFLADFYTAQRQYLEARQLFGDRRADKHHSARPDT